MKQDGFIRFSGAFLLIIAALVFGSCGKEGPSPLRIAHPNVLFISVDDLNDWIEPLGGHSQARTPNLERLAQQSVNFTHNYCASPACNPSRTALLTGRHTYSSGLYSNYQWWREVLPDAVTLPRYFSDHGYWSAGAGKIFHNNMPDPGSWDDYFPSKERHMPAYVRPNPEGTVHMPPFENMYMAFDWAPLDIPDEETGDYKSVSWVIDQLNSPHDKPFFLACGIYRPHLPWYVPQKYFDMFPLDSIQLPKVLENDLADIGERGQEIAVRGGDYHKHVLEADQWKLAVQGYLASIAYADALVGRLLDALSQSVYSDNTIVVLWSDHGWQLGEKDHWRKFALWENVVKTVLMINVPPGVGALPEGTPAGARCDRITSLLDLFPTLLELCGLPQKSDLDGHSLVPLLRDPQTEWDFPALTTYDFWEFSVRTERWRYTRYIDDSEELYDHTTDPEEWTNLAGRPEYQEVIKTLKAHIPSVPAPLVNTSYKIEPHHYPPFRTREEYREWKKTGIRKWDK
jgi:arylsulfatase A-like enzyme